MARIDADAHVIETARTWDYMEEHEQEFHPQIFVRDENDRAPYQSNQRNEYGKIGDDNLIVGTDYGHKDMAVEIEVIKRLGEDGGIAASSVEKILETNPCKLYGFV